MRRVSFVQLCYNVFYGNASFIKFVAAPFYFFAFFIFPDFFMLLLQVPSFRESALPPRINVPMWLCLSCSSFHCYRRRSCFHCCCCCIWKPTYFISTNLCNYLFGKRRNGVFAVKQSSLPLLSTSKGRRRLVESDKI